MVACMPSINPPLCPLSSNAEAWKAQLPPGARLRQRHTQRDRNRLSRPDLRSRAYWSVPVTSPYDGEAVIGESYGP